MVLCNNLLFKKEMQNWKIFTCIIPFILLFKLFKEILQGGVQYEKLLLKVNLAQTVLDASLFKIEETGIQHQECNKREAQVFNLSYRINFLKIVPVMWNHSIKSVLQQFLAFLSQEIFKGQQQYFWSRLIQGVLIYPILLNHTDQENYIECKLHRTWESHQQIVHSNNKQKNISTWASCSMCL